MPLFASVTQIPDDSFRKSDIYIALFRSPRVPCSRIDQQCVYIDERTCDILLIFYFPHFHCATMIPTDRLAYHSGTGDSDKEVVIQGS
jgi:hypothetical protein